MKAASLVLAIAAAATACKSKDKPAAQAGDDTAAAPARAEATKLDLGSGPIRNPLNLYDIGIAGSPDYETAGTIGGVRVSMNDLESHSVGVFSRISERLYAAEDAGYRWLVERVALSKLAEAEGKPYIPYLLEQYGQLPQPTPEGVEEVLADVDLIEMSANERLRLGRTMWRLQLWSETRQELVLRGRENVQFERLRRQITNPEYAEPTTIVARLDGKELTRKDVRALAGYGGELARHEYWRLAKMQFEQYSTEFLLEREAQHIGVTVDELLALEAKKQPAPTDKDVDAYLRDNPEYASDPQGRERAADNLRRLRQIDTKAALVKRLRSETPTIFSLLEPEIARFPIEIPAPRFHGDPKAEHVIVAFHSVGCDTCARGSGLLLQLLKKFDGRVKLVAGDYFEPGRLGSYRGAAALQCAPPENRDELLFAMTLSFGTGEISQLVAQAEKLGIEQGTFEDCLEMDRPLPVIFENLEMARRLGLQRNVLGLFANGVRIGELKDLDGVAAQIEAAIALTPL